MHNFILVELVLISSIYITTFLLGLVVVHYNVKVNYTRKGVHFLLFFLPSLLEQILPYEHSLATFLVSVGVFLAAYIPFIRPIREKILFFSIGFASFDRPEDRPYTLLWASTQMVGIYISVLIVIILLSNYDKIALVGIVSFVTGIGDGLAEPIGIRFGKHAYQTKGFFCKRIYTRSLEGSAWILLTGLAAVCYFSSELDSIEFILALIVIPITLTLAEAFSPHTWDNPFMLLSGGISIVVVIELAKLLS